MFRGSSSHKLDQKGRLSIPSRFKKDIESEETPILFLTRMDNCIRAYPESRWMEIEETFRNLKTTTEKMRRFFRTFIGSVAECELDKQSRIIIPQNLRDYAKLQKDVVLVGVLEHFEIWSEENWQKENEILEQDLLLEDFQEEIAQLGL
ncbi:MAG: division/cell wall cluster transcriptional repressor MraZ [Desulfobacteraceae bacterium]|nr:division/cell wall cluster transcriptional repressor MraZ [Desulfobacteraceae bacterium]MCB9494516.1 division/cell wall cluster transcriptional repressor MraZ [Desulfobacteraceae bacterium]